MNQYERKKIVEKTWIIVLMCLFFPPGALLLIWYVKRPKNMIFRILLSIYLIISTFILVFIILPDENETPNPTEAISTETGSATTIATEAPAEATTKATTETTTKATTETAKSTAPTVSLDEQYDTYIKLITPTMNDNWGDDYTIEKQDGAVVINVWADGIAAGALYANEGNDQLKEQWSQMRGNVTYFAEQCYKTMQTCGFNDGHVNVNLLNEVNKENTLLSFYDGVCVYDAVEK